MATAQNNYGEYIIVNGKWERIGDRMPDPSSYINKEELAAVTDELKALAEKDEELSGKIDTINTNIETLSEDFVSLSEQVSNNAENIASNASAIKDLGLRADTLDEQYSVIESTVERVTALENRDNDIISDVNLLRDIIGNNLVDDKSLSTRVSNLETWSVGITTDIAHHFAEFEGRVSDLEQASNDSIETVTETVTKVNNLVEEVEGKLVEVIEVLPSAMDDSEIETAINAAIDSAIPK